MTDEPVLTNEQALMTLASEAELIQKVADLERQLDECVQAMQYVKTVLELTGRRVQAVLALDPADYATTGRDYSRGIGEGILIAQMALTTE